MRAKLVLILKPLAVGVGVLCIGLGIVGAFVPVMPTTPFLLVAAACFLYGSPRAHRWLMGHRILGPYLQNYRRGYISRWTRLVVLALLWGMISYSALVRVESIPVRVLLFGIAIAVTVHLIMLRTLPKETREERS